VKLETGNPTEEGRYVAFVQCTSGQVREWAEPIIATWHGGRWHCAKTVYGWAGPIPPLKLAAFQMEYDL
jgi:hypothetical protein